MDVTIPLTTVPQSLKFTKNALEFTIMVYLFSIIFLSHMLYESNYLFLPNVHVTVKIQVLLVTCSYVQ